MKKIRLGVLGVGVAAVAVLLAMAILIPKAPQVAEGWTAPDRLPASVPLPVSRIAFDSDRTGNFEIFSVQASGGPAEQLTSDENYDSWSPRLSPDRRTILFHRTPAGKHDLDYKATSLWAMGADGSGAVELRPPGLDGWVQQGHAEWSPDGTSLVMFGGSWMNPQIYITDELGKKPRAVTDRPGVNLDPAFTPDGREIVFVGCPGAVCGQSDYEIYQVSVEGGTATRLTSDDLRDHDPYVSPDGRRLAWLTAFGGAGVGVWDVRIGDRDGSDPVRLVGDTGITSRPDFSRDGQYIFVHRVAPGRSAFSIYRVSLADGRQVEVTKGQPGNNEYPSS